MRSRTSSFVTVRMVIDAVLRHALEIERGEVRIDPRCPCAICQVWSLEPRQENTYKMYSDNDLRDSAESSRRAMLQLMMALPRDRQIPTN